MFRFDPSSNRPPRPLPRHPAGARGARLVLAAVAALALAPGAPRARGGGDPGGVRTVDADTLWSDLPDVAAERGLTYVNRSGEPQKRTILESHGAGVALLDLGTDGDLDVVFGQGLGSLAELLEGPGADLEVFLNDGSANFERGRGPGLSGWWTGLAAGDVDGDGDTDLVAGAYGDLALLLQEGDGRLARHAAADDDLMPTEEERPGARLVPGEPREPGEFPLWVTALGLLDADRDGYLDLYVGQHLDLDPTNPPEGSLGEGALELPCVWKGQQVYCGPHGFRAQPDRLLKGLGDGHFVDRTAEWLPELEPAFTLALAAFDAEADGDTDLYVANDSTPNRLLINEGGKFLDVADGAGVAMSQDGEAEAGMGVAIGDVNRDGLPDMALTNFSEEPTQLYFGSEVGFSVETFRWALAHQTRALLSWGVHLVDLDGDGWLELFTANGHVYPQADAPGTGTSYGQPDTLWRLGPDGKARRLVPRTERDLLAPATGSRGSAVGDLDGDGRPDLVVVRIDGPAALALNRMGAEAHRLEIRLVGPDPVLAQERPAPRTPLDARGTIVIVTPETAPDAPLEEGLPRMAELQTSSSYLSSSSPWLSFGLGASESYRLVEIRWPSGKVGRFGPGKAGKRLIIRQGEGVLAVEDLPALDRARDRAEASVAAATEPPEGIERPAPGGTGGPGDLRDMGDTGGIGATGPAGLDRSELGPAYPGDAVYRPEKEDPPAVAAARAALERDELDTVQELLTEMHDGARVMRFPDSPEALLVLAQAHSRSGRLDLAAPLCERFVELAPLHPEVGAVWHLLAMDARARRDLDAYRERLDMAQKTTRLHDALPVRRGQILRAPEDPKPVLALALAWLEADELERGRTILRTLTERQPKYARGWASLGYAERLLGHLEAAAEAYRKSLQLEPENPPAHLHLAAVLFALGREDEGITELRGLAASEAGSDPRFRNVHVNLARALLAKGDAEGAKTAYARYRELGGREPMTPKSAAPAVMPDAGFDSGD